jgi:hypothetical protein
VRGNYVTEPELVSFVLAMATGTGTLRRAAVA